MNAIAPAATMAARRPVQAQANVVMTAMTPKYACTGMRMSAGRVGLSQRQTRHNARASSTAATTSHGAARLRQERAGKRDMS